MGSQVGIIIHGTTIETTVMGGPAYNSKQIDPGDVILRVDGENATADNIKDLLVGEDLPGSSVTIALAKGGPQVYMYVQSSSSRFAAPEHPRLTWLLSVGSCSKHLHMISDIIGTITDPSCEGSVGVRLNITCT